MAFGITSAGFVAKRLADIKAELEDDYRSTFGASINLDSRGPFGQILGIQAERESLLWELAEAIYNSQSPKTAQGTGVDNALDLVGLERKDATFSLVNQTFYGAPGTIIPINTQVSQSIDPDTVFSTTVAGEILAGTGLNNQQSVAFSSVPDAGTFTIDFDGQATNPLAFNILAAQLQTELENLSNVGAGNVSVSGDFSSGFLIQFTNGLGESPQEQITIPTNSLTALTNPVTATPTTTRPGLLPSVTIEAIATVEGPVDAPAFSLDTLDSSVAGVDSVSNLLDADLGTDTESDADALARREISLATPGHTTIPAIRSDLLQIDGVLAVKIFENEDLVEDLAGRPGKSYEAVVQGGDTDTIFDVILDTKGAGIRSFGSLSKVLTDSQGFNKTVFFSRPVEVPVFLDFILKVNGNYPVDGDDQVAAALLAFGNDLNIGDDVIVFPQLICSLNNIPGIIDIDIKIDSAAILSDGTQGVSFINDAGELRADTVGHPLQVGNRVKFSNPGGTLPGGVVEDQLYFVIESNPNNFKFSESFNGSALQFISGDSGVTNIVYGEFNDNINISDRELADFDSSRITVVSS